MTTPTSNASATSPATTAAINSVPGQSYVDQLATNSKQPGYQADVTGVSGVPAAGVGGTPAQLAAANTTGTGPGSSDPTGTVNDITTSTTPQSAYTDAMNTYLASLKNSNALTLADTESQNNALNRPGETTDFASTDAGRIKSQDAFGIDAANNTTSADLDAVNSYKALLPATPTAFNLSPGETRYNGDGTVAASLPATPAKLSTSVVNVGGRQVLIDDQTGKTIQDLGASTPTATQTSTAAANQAGTQLTAAVGPDGYTDPNLYAKLRAASTLSAPEFDDRFGYLVNPVSATRLGLSTTASTPFATPTATDKSTLMTALAANPKEAASVDMGKLATDPQYFYWVQAQLNQ